MAKAKKVVSNKARQIFIGVGGWDFPPWRSTFYPEKLPHHRDLDYAVSKLTSIEINGILLNVLFAGVTLAVASITVLVVGSY